MTVWGELWKVAREQCRHATSTEKAGVELVLSEYKELVEEYKRNARMTGFKDLTAEPWPADEEEVDKRKPLEEEKPQQRRARFEEQPQVFEDDDLVPSPSSPMEDHTPAAQPNQQRQRSVGDSEMETIESDGHSASNRISQ